MTNETGSSRIYQATSDALLLSGYEIAQKMMAQLRQEIETRMLERNAVAIPDDTYLCEMPKRYTYFHEKFAPLKEALSSQELGECWDAAWAETIPEHVEQHPETWNTVKLLKVARRHGDEAMRVIENARNEGRGSLTFRRKE